MPEKDITEILPKLSTKLRPLRVAAYCRVSSLSKQESSLNLQMKTYRQTIKNNPLWIYAGVYYDTKPGRNSQRPGLEKLLQKCEQGKVDLIIMKSLSRFMRNTVDALVLLRHLKEIGVGVYFEIGSINTLDEKSELVITIFASLAQMEGENISANTKWGIEHSVQNPNSKQLSRPCYGYRRTADGTGLEIHEEEAEVVRWIYQLRSMEFGYKRIRNALKERNIPSPTGNPEWSIQTIKQILQNEKYKGEVLFYKRFIEDYPSKHRRINRGEHAQYHCNDHHPAIIN